MAKNIKTMTVESLTDALVHGTISMNEVGIDTENQRQALLAAVEKRNALLKALDGEDAEKKLKYILSKDKNYKLFVQLTEEQYTDTLAQIYLYGRMSEVNFAITGDNYQLNIGKSFDGKIILTYTYVTGSDEAVHYMDSELGLPLSIKSGLKLVLKVDDGIMLIKSLDTSVLQLGPKKINAVLFDTLVSRYRAYFAEYISEKKVGYYTMCSTLCDIQSSIMAKLGGAYAPFGISVSELVIRKMAIPEDIKNKVEELAFRIRQRHAETEANAELAGISLRSYEEKLAIQAKYPDIEPSLTEYEKDLALQRYLAKVGRAEEEEIDHEISISGKVDATDASIVKQIDVVPEEKKYNTFKIGYIATLALSIFIAFIVMSSNLGAGLIMLAVVAAIFGAVAAFNIERFSSQAEKNAVADADDKEGE